MKIKFLTILLILCSISVFSQNYTISGYVQEESNGENLIGVSVFDKSSNKGTSTNQYGFYSITLPKGKYEILYSFIGLKTIEKSINLEENTRINVSLKENATLINEIEITEEGLDKNVEKTSMSQVKLKIQNIKSIPAILGEVDVLKAAQLLPGISGGGEGSAGLYVRGGGPDQNLVLLDEAVVYNAAHLFGFFSVFNADAIKDINIIKGGMPAEYGGRLSSVLDITMKDGNNKEYQVDGGIGLLSSRMTLQGPIQKDKSSFIISGRRTYIDVLSKPFLNKKDEETGEPDWDTLMVDNRELEHVDDDGNSTYKVPDEDMINETTEKAWNALDVSRKAEKEVDNKEWNSRTTAKLDMLIALNAAGKFKKDFDEERLQGWVDQNYSWEKLSRQFKVNEGSCGYGPNGVPGDTPGETQGMDADDRTRGMMKKFIQKEIAKLHEIK